LAVGRPAEAEVVYRESLARLPNDGWALFGLAKSLHELGRHAEATEFDARFAEVWRDADIKITSSCFCQTGKGSNNGVFPELAGTKLIPVNAVFVRSRGCADC